MADERFDKNQDPTKDLENLEVTELDDQDLENASGGVGDGANDGISDPSPVNVNCGC